MADRRRDAATVHAEHDALHDVLRGWFTNSAPEIDYLVAHHPYGYLSEPRGSAGSRLILTLDDPAAVPDALGDAEDRTRGPVSIWVDDRARVARLDRALRASGYEPAKATTHLALVGALAASPGPASLTVHDVGEEELEEWAMTKLKSFGDTEAAPGRERIDAEVAVRGPELALARLQLARLDGEGVAVLGYYDGTDQLAFTLGTRVPFRHRGIAQQVLSWWVARGREQGCRSLMINADHHGRPEALYRQMGFVDEVYWYQRYEHIPAVTP